MTLWDVKPGEKATITGYIPAADEPVQKRLADLGFAHGTVVHCLRHTPFSGPRVYSVSGSVFALEKQMAVLVLAEPKKGISL